MPSPMSRKASRPGDDHDATLTDPRVPIHGGMRSVLPNRSASPSSSSSLATPRPLEAAEERASDTPTPTLLRPRRAARGRGVGGAANRVRGGAVTTTLASNANVGGPRLLPASLSLHLALLVAFVLSTTLAPRPVSASPRPQQAAAATTSTSMLAATPTLVAATAGSAPTSYFDTTTYMITPIGFSFSRVQATESVITTTRTYANGTEATLTLSSASAPSSSSPSISSPGASINATSFSSSTSATSAAASSVTTTTAAAGRSNDAAAGGRGGGAHAQPWWWWTTAAAVAVALASMLGTA